MTNTLTQAERQTIEEHIDPMHSYETETFSLRGIDTRICFNTFSIDVTFSSERIQNQYVFSQEFVFFDDDNETVLLKNRTLSKRIVSEFLENGKLVSDHENLSYKVERTLISPEEAREVASGRPYFVHTTEHRSQRVHQLEVFVDGDLVHYLVPDTTTFSKLPNIYVDGELMGEKKMKMFPRRGYEIGFTPDDVINVFFWNDDDKFRIVADKLVHVISETTEDNQTVKKANSIYERYSCNINKETGKVYISKGKQVRFGTYNSFTQTGARLGDFLNLLPRTLLKLIFNEFKTRLEPWVQAEYPEVTKEAVSQVIYKNYFKSFQYIKLTAEDVNPDTWDSYNSYLRGLSLNSYSSKRLKEVSSQSDFCAFLYPTLGKKQRRQVTFEPGKDLAPDDAWFLHLMIDPNHIREYLEVRRYSLPVNDFGGKRAVRRLKEQFYSMTTPERLEAIILKWVKENHYYRNNTLPTDILRSLELLKDQELEPFEGKTLRDLHDHLIHQIRAVEDATYEQPIAYSKQEKALETAEDDYILTLAESKKDLKQVGDAMSICVGSLYARPAFNKELTIAVVRDRKSLKPLLCIELVNKNIRQAKKRFNDSVYADEPLGRFFKNWQKKNKLKLETQDYREGAAPLNTTAIAEQIDAPHNPNMPF